MLLDSAQLPLGISIRYRLLQKGILSVTTLHRVRKFSLPYSCAVPVGLRGKEWSLSRDGSFYLPSHRKVEKLCSTPGAAQYLMT